MNIPHRWIQRAALAWTAVVVVATLLPRSELQHTTEGIRLFHFANFDKIAHFGLFVIFGLLAGAALSLDRPRYLLTLVLGVVLGGLTELGQSMPAIGREAGWDDFFADVAGVLAGLGILKVLHARGLILGARASASEQPGEVLIGGTNPR